MTIASLVLGLGNAYRAHRFRAWRRTLVERRMEQAFLSLGETNVRCAFPPPPIGCLENLPSVYRAAWSAAAVTRLCTVSRGRLSFSSTEQCTLEIVVDALWNCVLDHTFNDNWLVPLRSTCADVLADHLQDYPPGTDGYIAALAFSAAARCLDAAKSGSSDEAQGVCHLVLATIEEVYDKELYGSEWRIGERHHVKGAYALAELEHERQLRDLKELQLTTNRPSPNVIRRLRDRALSEAATDKDMRRWNSIHYCS